MDSKKLVLWTSEVRTRAGEGGVLTEVRGTVRASGGGEGLFEDTGRGGGWRRGGGSLRMELGETEEW